MGDGRGKREAELRMKSPVISCGLGMWRGRGCGGRCQDTALRKKRGQDGCSRRSHSVVGAVLCKDAEEQGPPSKLKSPRGLGGHRRTKVPKGGHSPIPWFQAEDGDTCLRYVIGRTLEVLARCVYGEILGYLS